MAYAHTRSRNLSTTRIPTLLPDIAELSPNLEPTRTPTRTPSHTPSRTPSPIRPSLRRISVASFLSDGTVEIDGFGFDTVSEAGDDNDIDALSLYGGESVYEDSVFGDYSQDRDNTDGHNHQSQSRESQDLSRRAERILASAKRRLDRCGQNISKARNSIILSPTMSPTMSPTIMGTSAGLPDIASIASVMEMDDVLGQFPVPRSRTGSAASATEARWRKPEQTSMAAVVGGAFAMQREHQRTASESAVSNGAGPETAVSRKLSGVPEEQVEGKTARSRSAQQMRSLRDQMKDLRGKISSLQEQAQKDRERDKEREREKENIRRRQSVSSLRSNGSGNSGFYSTPSLEEIRESRVLDINGRTRDEWEDMLPAQRDSRRISRSSSRSSGTPKPGQPRSDSVSSPFSERHEDRFDAFSYDSLLIGNSFVHRRAPSSSSSASTATVLQPPTLNRSDSQNSISSYATATESFTPRFHPLSPSTSTGTLRDRNPSPSTTASSGVSSPATAIMGGLRPPPTSSAANDDGYHSAPQTPHPPQPRSSRTTPVPAEGEQSWYRDSIATEAETVTDGEGYGRDPSPTTGGSRHQRNQPSYSSSTYSQPSTITPYTNFVSLSSSRNSRSSRSSRSSERLTPTAPTRHVAPTPVAITSSHRDSQTMILGGVVKGKEEVELKVGREDRLLIEGVIETLGRVCCEMETSPKSGGRREELRERLRGAMRVLEGWEGELEMF